MSEVVLPIEVVLPEVQEGEVVEKKGIKETMELIDLVQTSVDVYKSANADGKLNYADFTKLGPMFPALKSGLGDAKEIPAELKDLDKEEMAIVLAALTKALTSLVGAVLS
jgi:hypothetical protein